MNKKELKVSIIIPVFNAERYLSDCLNSIVSQSMKEIEILCIDDGSIDNSKYIIKENEEKDFRIKYYEYGTNRGQAYARNFGLNLAKGKYIFFMDADDMLSEKNTLELLYNTAETEKLQGIVFDAKPIFENEILKESFGMYELHMKKSYDGIYTGEKIFREFMMYDDFHPAVWQQFWNATYIQENELTFCVDSSPHEDLLFSFQAILLCQRLKHIPQELYIYRCRENSSTSGVFSLKRFRAYLICYYEAIQFLLKYNFQMNLLFSITKYLNGIKNILKIKSVEFLKIGMDVLDMDFPTNMHRVFLNSILTERYSYLNRTFNNLEYKMLKDATCIIVYGAGTVGEEMIQMLSTYGFQKYIIAVTDKDECGKFLNRKDIVEIDTLSRYSSDSVVLVSAGAKYQSDMIANLVRLGFDKYICVA